MRTKVIGLILFWLCGNACPGYSADWGYEEPAPVISPPGTQSQPAGLPPGTSKQQALEYWLQLCTFVSPQNLAAEEMERLKDSLNACLDSPRSQSFLSITGYWPKVRAACQGQPELLESYRGLFKALFRLLCRKQNNDPLIQMLSELLGPSRIAIAGNPPLTEDAINAYADMACFIYEQQHPGRSLDADDNRFTFAQVVRQKFIAAPTVKDKLAMINFDLSWSKFKVLWSLADNRQKQLLLSQWQAGTASTKPKADTTLDLVLNSGPWSTANNGQPL
jgi:hypothetical protein